MLVATLRLSKRGTWYVRAYTGGCHTYQLREAGVAWLQDHGFTDESEFGHDVFAQLDRNEWLYTGGDGAGPVDPIPGSGFGVSRFRKNRRWSFGMSKRQMRLAPLPHFSAGDLVAHRDLGVGRVTEVDSQYVQVAFDDATRDFAVEDQQILPVAPPRDIRSRKWLAVTLSVAAFALLLTWLLLRG